MPGASVANWLARRGEEVSRAWHTPRAQNANGIPTLSALLGNSM